MLDGVLRDVERILKLQKYQWLNDLRVRLREKYETAIREILKEVYLTGLTTVKEEFRIKDWIPQTQFDTQWMSAQAAAIALRHQQMIKEKTIFIVLAGLKKGNTTDQILWAIRTELLG